MRFPRATHRNVYVRSREAGTRVMDSVTDFLERKLKLKVNRDKSAVARAWERKFLGYTVTVNKRPRLKPAPESVKRAKARIRQITRRGKGRNIRRVIEDINLFTRGWIGYYRMAEVKQTFDVMDQWIRHGYGRFCGSSGRPHGPERRSSRASALGPRRPWATSNGRGPWWNAGAPHMHAAISNKRLADWGLLSLLQMRGG